MFMGLSPGLQIDHFGILKRLYLSRGKYSAFHIRMAFLSSARPIASCFDIAKQTSARRKFSITCPVCVFAESKSTVGQCTSFMHARHMPHSCLWSMRNMEKLEGFGACSQHDFFISQIRNQNHSEPEGRPKEKSCYVAWSFASSGVPMKLSDSIGRVQPAQWAEVWKLLEPTPANPQHPYRDGHNQMSKISSAKVSQRLFFLKMFTEWVPMGIGLDTS